MITKRQVENLSLYFGIDQITIFREYLQLIFLNYLYQEKKSERIYFKGGTCLHLLYGSPRFSEDLDFSVDLGKKEIKLLVKKVVKKIQKEISGITLNFDYSGKKSLRYKLKYQGKEFKYPLTIRLDFTFEKILLKPKVVKIETKFPINFLSLVLSLKEEEILAEKIRAFLLRAKGRDIFDLWYLFSENIFVKKDILEKKLKKVNLKFNQETFFEKIKKYPLSKLKLDLAKFLPRPYRKIIPELKERILEYKERFQDNFF